MLFCLLITQKFLGFLSVRLLKHGLLLLAAEDGHLSVFSDLIKLLLLVRLLLSPLVLLLILESVVPIPHLPWLAIHDVALVRLHIVFLI